jgi:HAD superfamily hydrolase (TIGR01509 family)
MSLVSSLDLNRDTYFFDLDGTLVDSLPVHEVCFRKVLAKNYPHALENFHYSAFLGWKTEDVFRALDITTDTASIRALTAAKQAAYRQAVEVGMVQPFASVREVLTWLVGKGRRLYVVTGGSAQSTAMLLARTHLGKLFSGCITASDVPASKPDPMPFLYALVRFQLEPKQCLTIEDSDDGALSSERAGVAAILVNRCVSAGGRPMFTDFSQLGSALQKALEEV